MGFASWKDESLPYRERQGLYYASREWGLLRNKIHERAGHKCERCRINDIDAVHHLTYVRMFRERLEDLQATCDGCHAFTHAKSDHDPAASKTAVQEPAIPPVRLSSPGLRLAVGDFVLHRTHGWGRVVAAGKDFLLRPTGTIVFSGFPGRHVFVLNHPETLKDLGRAIDPPASETIEKIERNSSPTIASTFDDPGITDPVVPPTDRPEAVRVIAEEIAGCTRCAILAANRCNTVPGEGSPTARLMFVGEGPGQTEDETGRPFVGRAGQLVTEIIEQGMGIRRDEVFIANIIKCRPPGNRDPEPEEVRNCIGYLERQIAVVRPEFLCLLGKPAAQTLLNTSMPMGRLRGKWQRYKGIPVIATWHPAYLLRNPSARREAWEDISMLMKAMGLPPMGQPDSFHGWPTCATVSEANTP